MFSIMLRAGQTHILLVNFHDMLTCSLAGMTSSQSSAVEDRLTSRPETTYRRVKECFQSVGSMILTRRCSLYSVGRSSTAFCLNGTTTGSDRRYCELRVAVVV